MGILVFLLAVTVVVAIHEYGHFLACRLLGVGVDKFAVGFGNPILKRVDKRGTEWSIRPLPLGGFVRPREADMEAASPLKKFIIAVAGPFANVAPLGAFAAFNGTLGLYLQGLWEIYSETATAIFNTLTFGIFHHAVVHPGFTTDSGALSGPVGIGAMSMQMNNEGGPLLSFLVLFFMLNLGLGLINLMPIPVFDGGRAVLAGVEVVAGRQRTQRIERVANYFGVAIIAALFLIVTGHDIINLL